MADANLKNTLESCKMMFFQISMNFCKIKVMQKTKIVYAHEWRKTEFMQKKCFFKNIPK